LAGCFSPNVNNLLPHRFSSKDFWCEDTNSASASADDVDYFLDDTLSIETEDDISSDIDLPHHHQPRLNSWSNLPFVDLESESEDQSLVVAPIIDAAGTTMMPSDNGSTIKNAFKESMLNAAGEGTMKPEVIQSSQEEEMEEKCFDFAFPTPGGGEFMVPPIPVPLPIQYGASNALEGGDTLKPEQVPDILPIKPDPYEFIAPAPVDVKREQAGKKRKPSFPRKQFRETVGAQILKDLLSEQFSYDEIIAKYSSMYPEYTAKFTPSFCSKVRCGRIMNPELGKVNGVSKLNSRVKRVSKLSHRKTWRKMTPELYLEIAAWEKNQNRPVKQVEFEKVFNVNRSTYYRWKKAKASNGQTKTFGN